MKPSYTYMAQAAASASILARMTQSAIWRQDQLFLDCFDGTLVVSRDFVAGMVNHLPWFYPSGDEQRGRMLSTHHVIQMHGWMQIGQRYCHVGEQMPTVVPITRYPIGQEPAVDDELASGPIVLDGAIEVLIKAIADGTWYDGVREKPPDPPNPTVRVRIECGPVLFERGWVEGRIGYESHKELCW